MRQGFSRTSSSVYSFQFPEVLQNWTIVCWLDEAGGWYVKERKDYLYSYFASTRNTWSSAYIPTINSYKFMHYSYCYVIAYNDALVAWFMYLMPLHYLSYRYFCILQATNINKRTVIWTSVPVCIGIVYYKNVCD